MSSWNDLLEFTRDHADELTLSAYIAASPPDPTERQSWVVVLRQHLNRVRDSLASALREEQAAFGRCVGVLFDQLPKEGTMPRSQSWAFFASAGGGTLSLQLPPGAETEVHWGVGAEIVPFLRVAEPDSALIVQIDRTHARLSVLNEGELSRLSELEADTVDEVGPFMGAAARVGFHAGTRGRPGAEEAQRQRREATDRLFTQVLKRIGALATRELPLVIGGAPDSAVRLLDALPDALARRAVLAEHLRMDDPARDREELRLALHALRARRQHERIEQWREAAFEGGRVALGFEGARKAAERGAIAELIFSDRAWREHPVEVEALVRRALADGARVEVAEPDAVRELDGTVDGVIAGLRFPIGSAA